MPKMLEIKMPPKVQQVAQQQQQPPPQQQQQPKQPQQQQQQQQQQQTQQPQFDSCRMGGTAGNRRKAPTPAPGVTHPRVSGGPASSPSKRCTSSKKVTREQRLTKSSHTPTARCPAATVMGPPHPSKNRQYQVHHPR